MTEENLLVGAPFLCMLFMYIQSMIDPDINGARQTYLFAGIVLATMTTLKTEQAEQLQAYDEEIFIDYAGVDYSYWPENPQESLSEW